MLALIKDAAIIELVVEGGGFAHDVLVGEGPETTSAWTMPAVAGWEGGAGYSLATVLEADPIPPGKTVISTSAQIIGGVPKYVHELADIAPVVPEVISDRQFFQALAIQGVITEEEALAAVKTGDIPSGMLPLIAGLPAANRFAAEMLLSGATEFKRAHPLTEAFGTAFGWTTPQIDAFWIAASAL